MSAGGNSDTYITRTFDAAVVVVVPSFIYL